MTVIIGVLVFMLGLLCGIFVVALGTVSHDADVASEMFVAARNWAQVEAGLREAGWKFVTPQLVVSMLTDDAQERAYRVADSDVDTWMDA